MNLSMIKYALVFILICGCLTAKQVENVELQVNNLFSDNMVLQQMSEIAIWGKYTAGEQIRIKGSWGEEVIASANKDAQWRTTLNTPEAGGPFEVEIITEDASIHIKDVLIGEVWLASGQSNMEMPLTGFLPAEPIDNYQEEIENANYPEIRFLNVARTMALSPKDNIQGAWKSVQPDVAGTCSATAFFFARDLYKVLNVPIGIISSSWGGTPVESWMEQKKIVSLGEMKEAIESLEPEKVAVFEEWFALFPKKKRPTTMEEWEYFDLKDEQYAEMDFDDAQWPVSDLPIMVENLPTTSNDGAYWFRTTVHITDLNTDYSFKITEGIDDADITYINGARVGWTHCYNCPRDYKVPSSILKLGENVIAIRVIDTGGGGGFSGEVTLTNSSGKDIGVSKNWRYMQIADFQSGHFLLFHENLQAFENPPEGLSSFSVSAHSPGVLYNGMIHPLIPFTLKGAIWYQGESNVGRHEQYLKLFPGMIQNWRDLWKEDFPFYYVQIAPFQYGGDNSSAWLRDAQRKSLHLPKTGMAITMDIGNRTSIHPGNKQSVGNRLARLALHKDYKRDLVPCGPLYKNHVIIDNKVIVQFEYSNGLSSKDLLGFEIAGADGNFVPATAAIVDNQVELIADNISEPIDVRYGWKDYTLGTLINGSGLPASSFTTE